MLSCLLGYWWLVTGGVAAQTPPAEPVVSVWYRGTPAGVPSADDLAAIRAHGFTGITWPASQTERLADVKRLAAEIGLTVSIQRAPVHLTPAIAAKGPERVDIVVSRLKPTEIPALVWRAVAHGARMIAFDPGASTNSGGSGLTGTRGTPQSWVAPAAALARNLTFNGRLFASVAPGRPVSIQPPAPPGVDVVLLEAPRVWVLVSTNTSAVAVTTVAELPPSVAPALWTSLLDGSNMSMLSRQIGPRWSFQLGPGEAAVWTIEK
jgi:hypothetical protein